MFPLLHRTSGQTSCIPTHPPRLVGIHTKLLVREAHPSCRHSSVTTKALNNASSTFMSPAAISQQQEAITDSSSPSSLIYIGRTAESLDEEIDSRGNYSPAFCSTLDIFKIGVGPSSSHTMGPMLAASRFLDLLVSKEGLLDRTTRLQARLHGSLAYTGKGHATDRATLLGLAGFVPHSYEFEEAEKTLKGLHESKVIHPAKLQGKSLQFDPESDLIFDFGPPLPQHPNGLTFSALDDKGQVLITEQYFSIGGGFVQDLAERQRHSSSSSAGECDPNASSPDSSLPFPFATATQMLAMAFSTGKSIAEMQLENEVASLVTLKSLSPADARKEMSRGIQLLWEVMSGCLNKGLKAVDGEILPGGLKLRRRAGSIFRAVEKEGESSANFPPHTSVLDHLLCYAMAVNEENAAGGRVVTAPTNGAAGVIPAVLNYYLKLCPGSSEDKIEDFFLTAAAIGSIVKRNASISGAELGCQAEVGSASAMAAAGLAAVLGGSVRQVENAAEIALEHHLGMSCDPIGGLVQAPCIERNGLGAIKAVSSASLALRGDGSHLVSLDVCVETMRQTGRDMSDRYKETSQGGLSINVTLNRPHVPNC